VTGNMKRFGCPYMNKGKLKAFLKKKKKTPGELLSLSRNQLKIITGSNRTLSFKKTFV
jgi:hypothetical protein